MKKLIALITICILTIIVNFGLWFFHTRTINNLVATVEKKINALGGELKYDEVVFDTFKSWSIQGALIKPRIMLKDKLLKQNLEMGVDRINFTSLPFDGKIVFTYSTESVFKISGENNAVKTMRLLHSDEANSGMEISFNSSLRELLGIINEDSKDSIFKAVKSVDFNTGKITVIDDMGGEYYNVDSIKLKLQGNEKNNNLTYDFFLNLKNGQYSEKYKFNAEEKVLYNNLKNMGKTNILVDFTYNQWQSKKQREFIDSAQENKKIKLSPVLDSNKIDFKTLEYKTDLFTLNLGGEFQAANNETASNIKILVHDYDDFFDLVINYLNFYIDKIKSQSLGGYLISRVDDAQAKKVKLFFNQFAVNKDDIEIKVVKNKGEGVTFSGKTWSEIMLQLQNIFLSPQKVEGQKDIRLGTQSSKGVEEQMEKKK